MLLHVTSLLISLIVATGRGRTVGITSRCPQFRPTEELDFYMCADLSRKDLHEDDALIRPPLTGVSL